MQLSSLGQLYLTEEEISQLIALYRDPNDPERVLWKVFEDDINHGKIQIFPIYKKKKNVFSSGEILISSKYTYYYGISAY